MINNRWSDFYKAIKDNSWPECETTYEFKFLPEHIQQEILYQHNGLKYFSLRDDDIEIFPDGQGWKVSGKTSSSDEIKKFLVANDFSVYFTDEIDGNGRLHSEVFPLVLEKLYPGHKFQNALEWCAGPGFIGFRLISDGIVESITMMDMYAPALQFCHYTWDHKPNRLTHKTMTTVQGSTVDCLDDKIFDLIVANPPNFDHAKINQSMTPTQFRITQDPGWATHNDFFIKIKKNLAKDGKILMMKHILGSQPQDHAKYITDGGLKINRIINIKQHPDFYFLEATYP